MFYSKAVVLLDHSSLFFTNSESANTRFNNPEKWLSQFQNYLDTLSVKNMPDGFRVCVERN